MPRRDRQRRLAVRCVDYSKPDSGAFGLWLLTLWLAVLGWSALVVGEAIPSQEYVDPGGRMEPTPDELAQVAITPNRGAQVPLEIPFVDSARGEVTLGDSFDGTRPVILTLNYSNCPMLCSLQLNGLFAALEQLQWDIGENFQMVTVSIDPLETPEEAEATKQRYLKLYGRPGVGDAWHSLVTSNEEDIHSLADVVGFGYAYDARTEEYAHPAVAIVLTPDGRVSQYLTGVVYEPQTVRLALLEAGQGQIGSTLDMVLLYCLQFDPERGRYTVAMNVMRAGGLVTLLALAGMIFAFWRVGNRRGVSPAAGEASAGGSANCS